MHKNFIYSLVVGALFLMGCNGKDKLVQFKLDYTSEVIVPSSTGINLPFNLFTPDMETNTEATCEVNNTRIDLVKNILLTELKMTVTTPNGEDFSFLKSIAIYLKADGVDELKIAWNDDISADATSPLSLNVATENLDDYIKKEQFTLRCNAVTDEVIATDYHINVYTKYNVDAALLKK